MYVNQFRGYISDSEHSAKSATSYLVETTRDIGETDAEFNPIIAEIIPTEITGIVGTPPFISVGTNYPDYDNIIGNVQLSGLLLAQLVPLQSPLSPIGEEEEIYAKVNNVALLYTTYKFKVALIGYETYS